jgi:D-lactate dehydrogenase (cytochrome)
MASGIEPRCVELLDCTCISSVNNSLDKSISPFPPKPHIFFKLSGTAKGAPEQQEALTSVFKKAGGTHLRIARNEKEGELLWDIRKSLAYSILAMLPGSNVISTDVCVPVSRLPTLIEQYKKDQERINEEIAAKSEDNQPKKLISMILGHVGDGNFHSLMYIKT